MDVKLIITWIRTCKSKESNIVVFYFVAVIFILRYSKILKVKLHLHTCSLFYMIDFGHVRLSESKINTKREPVLVRSYINILVCFPFIQA